jgi:hypothetical protein
VNMNQDQQGGRLLAAQLQLTADAQVHGRSTTTSAFIVLGRGVVGGQEDDKTGSADINGEVDLQP